MEYHIHRMSRQYPADPPLVSNVGLIEEDAEWHYLLVSRGEIVNDNNGMAMLNKPSTAYGSDVAGTACY